MAPFPGEPTLNVRGCGRRFGSRIILEIASGIVLPSSGVGSLAFSFPPHAGGWRAEIQEKEEDRRMQPRKPQDKKHVPLMLTMEPATKERLKQLAAQKHVSVSQLITNYAWKSKLKDAEPDETE